MRLLLDTHVFLWSALEPDKISDQAQAAISDGENEVYVSVVTAWEIAIKQSLGKLTLVTFAELWVPQVIRRSGFEVLPLEIDTALAVRALPFHHRDPFDRLLIAHAATEGLTIVTHDDAFPAYGIPLLRV